MCKKLIALMIFVMLICCGCAGKKQKTVVSTLDTIRNNGIVSVGVRTDSFPFGYIDRNGKNAGYDIDVAKIIAKAITGEDGKIKFVPVTASDRMMKLYSEQVDMIIATTSVTPTREKIMDFSDAYYVAGQAILVRSNSNITNLRELRGKKVIIVFGSTSERSLRDTIPNVQILGYKTYDDAYKALKNGKGDAIVSDDTILMGFALKDNGVKLLPKRYTKEPYAVGFRKGAESKELIKLVNGVLGAQRRNGTLNKLQKEYGIKQY